MVVVLDLKNFKNSFLTGEAYNVKIFPAMQVNYSKETGTFITRCKNYKRDSINQHEKSESHKVNVIKFNGQKNPQNSEGAKALRALNQLTRASGILKGPVVQKFYWPKGPVKIFS